MLVSHSSHDSIHKPGLGVAALPLIQGCCEGGGKLSQNDSEWPGKAIFKAGLRGAQCWGCLLE